MNLECTQKKEQKAKFIQMENERMLREAHFKGDNSVINAKLCYKC